MITRNKIVRQVLKIFAKGGLEQVSMRTIAKKVHVVPSVIYYYFPTKTDLLLAMYTESNTLLGKKRSALPQLQTASDMLRQRIEFQIDNAELIVSVLKFYLAFRKEFPKQKEGFLPEKTYLHIQEVLDFGVSTGEFANEDLSAQARVIVHAINGYLLEFYPNLPKNEERERVVNELHRFVYRGIHKKVYRNNKS